ncbi:nitroreductase family protein [Novosphingobium aquimarinum]|uniref:nitroreductase family protein n=1 Tax=Novosphingobium aquimarinum TaxID=2682494 RepID=UPI0012EB3A77|nr:nitroreductase family protein [Novosphingobium aquimarinum]
MACHTDPEPAPRFDGNPSRRLIEPGPVQLLPRDVRTPDAGFFEVLGTRRSGIGGPLDIDDLSALLWHSTALRSRTPGRFGVPAESRNSPSGGGLHPIRLLVLPLEDGAAGFYDDQQHGLMPVGAAALAVNRESISTILGHGHGTTVQFAADRALLDACYRNASSILWRDAGALITTMCLIATALGIAACPVGRVGNDVVVAAGVAEGFVGAGAVHFGGAID